MVPGTFFHFIKWHHILECAIKKGTWHFSRRDSNAVEVDLLLDEGSSFLLYEIKSSKTLRPEMAKALGLVVLKPAKKFVVSFHEKSMPLAGSAVTAGDHDRRRVYHAHTDFTGGYRAAENVIQKMLNVETFDIYTI